MPINAEKRNVAIKKWIQSRMAFHLAVFGFYLLAAALALNNLVLRIGSVVSSGPLNDYHLFTWNNWWLRYALFTLHTDPYFTDYVLFPYQHNLSVHALTPILAPIDWLLSPLLGDPATMNAILWLSFAVTGTVTFWFLRRWIGNAVGALIGGLLFTFLPGMMDHAVNYHANMWCMFWLPGILLLWDRVARTRQMAAGLVYALIFGVALWGLWMTDPQFLVWTPFLLLPFGVLTLIQAKQRARLVLFVVLALAVMAVLLLIAPLPAMLRGDLGPTSPARYETARAYSLPLSAFFFAPGDADRSIGRVIILLALLALVARPMRFRPRRWFWFAVSLPPLILSLGPDVQIGDQLIPLPYRLIHDALHGLYRFPSRFAPVGVLALLVFIGMSLRPRRRLLVTVILVPAILVDGRLLAPFPVQQPLPDYAIYHAIGAESGDYVILDVPVTIHSGWAQVGGDQGQRAMWYQMTHHKKEVNGALSRIPDIEHLFYEQSPLLGWFSGSQAPNVPAASEELARFAREWPVGYVIVHLDWLDPAASLPILGFLNKHPAICLYTQERDLVVYRNRSYGCPLPAGSAESRTVNFGQQGDEQYLVNGWYPRESIGGASARWSHGAAQIKLLLYPGRDYELSFYALGYGDDRQATIRANDTAVATVKLPENWAVQSVRIPASTIPPTGELVITFAANGEISPAARTQSGDTRVLSAAYQWLRLTPVAP